MNDPLEKFAELAKSARAAPPPPLDLAENVLAELRTVRPRSKGDALVWSISGAAVLAASLTLMLNYRTFESLSDPLAGLLEPISMVLQ
jgi:hypothetical protein